MSTLALVVVGSSLEKLKQFKQQQLEVDELILVNNRTGVFGGYGKLANHWIDRISSDVFGIVHADTILGEGMCNALVKTAMSGAIAGVVGKAHDESEVWAYKLEPGKQQGVSTLDSCSMFVSMDTIRRKKLRFDDQTFDSFHCCVEDFCLQGVTKGLRIIVPAGQCNHLGERTRNPEWQADYRKYRKVLGDKWKNVQFVTT